MRILAIVLALVLVSGDEPPSQSQVPIAVEDPEVKLTHFTGNQPFVMPKVPKPRFAHNPDPCVPWNLSLADAIRIGLVNSEILWTKPTAGDIGLEIEPIDRDGSLWEFQTRAMALVRLIEREYGTLWREHTTLQARETAVRQAEEILRQARDEREVSRGPVTPVAEIEAKLDNLKLELVSTTSATITVDRQLRNVLGLAPEDGRQIIPSTPPIEAKVVPDWASSLVEMNASQPDIAQQKVIARLHELQLLLARNQLLPLMGLDAVFRFRGIGSRLNRDWEYLAKGICSNDIRNHLSCLDLLGAYELQFTHWQTGVVIPIPMLCFRSPLANVRQAQYQLIRQRAALQATTWLATDSLSRSFREIEANHDQFTVDRRASVDARVKREAQRGYYEEGRISAGQMLDAFGREAHAIAQEARSLAAYNASLVAFEEAKGSLLDWEGIAWAGSPNVAPIAQALGSISSNLSDGSPGLRLIQEGLAHLPNSIGYPVIPF
jgi:outer membrane protein TolC